MNIKDILLGNATAAELKGFYDARGRISNKGSAVFTNTRIRGDQYKFAKGTKGVAKLIKMGAYDSNVPLRRFGNAEMVQGELALFREGSEMTEKDMANLVMLGNVGGNDALKTEIRSWFNAQANLIDSLHQTAEHMRLRALANLELDFGSNGAWYKAQYSDNPDSQKGEVTVAWSDFANSTPLTDIMAAKKLVGASSIVGYVSQTTFGYLLQNASLKNAIFASMATYGILTEQIVRQYIATNFGCTFIVFDDLENQYTDYDGTVKQHFPDGIVTFAPVGPLGQTVWGTAPEENATLLGLDRGNVNTVIVDEGISVTTRFLVDSVKFETIVSAVVAPVFQSIDYVYVLNVTPEVEGEGEGETNP